MSKILTITLATILTACLYVLITIVNLPENEVFNPSTNEYVIPEWVKSNAYWWSQGEISQQEFSYSMQYLVDEGIIEIKKCEGKCIEDNT